MHDDIEGAVRKVLPALNLAPASFELDRGFLVRARRRSRPSVLTLNDLAIQRWIEGALCVEELSTMRWTSSRPASLVLDALDMSLS